MLFIDSIWKQYFTTPHEGLGTTYERFILHKYFRKIKERYKIQSVLEVPSFGMTGVSGINSLWWAFENSKIAVADHNKERISLIKNVWKGLSVDANFVYNRGDYLQIPFDDKSFDMSWNFAALGYVTDPNRFIKELVRVSRKTIFICVPNRSNIFYWFRKAFQKNKSNLPDACIGVSEIKEIMQNLSWVVREQGYMDIPPWPDIAMNKEDLFQRIGMAWIAEKLKNKGENNICILDYFSGKNINMDKEILKYGFLENAPLFFQKLWAHHQYLIFTPRN